LASGSRSRNSASNSAAPGSTIVVYGTGLGAAEHPEVLIAGKSAKLLSASKAAASGDAADEIKAVLPAAAPEGCFVPLQVRGAGRMPSNIVTLAIRRGESWCNPPEHVPLAGQEVHSIGLMLAARTIFHDRQAPQTFDEAGGFFARLTAEAGRLNPLLAPPLGSCNAHSEEGQADLNPPDSLLRILFSHPQDLLDAGPLVNINDGRIQRRILGRAGQAGSFYGWFNDPIGASVSGPLGEFLAPAHLQIKGSGGGEIGAFSVSLPGPEAFEWTDPAPALQRAEGLDLHWKNAAPGRVMLIMLAAQAPASIVRGFAVCAAPADAGGFRVPPETLLVLPPIPATIMIASWPSRPSAFTVQGADRAIGVSAFAHSARITLR
jgi:hypothetical protein